ncbi:MAG: TolC family protein [Halanaerobiales bacterium]|nr:TolC family protein [Halanaerobiales bacterium]
MLIKSRDSVLFAIILILLTFSVNTYAEDYNFEKLITYGLNNNIEIRKLENEIQIIKNNIKLTNAQGDWQANLNLNKSLIEEENVIVTKNKDQINLSINKKIVQNKLTINPNFSYDFDGSDFIYGISMNFDLYPNIPSESIKNIITLNNQINQKQKELYNKKAELLKKWLDQYLQLIRLDENINLLEKRLKLAEDNYKNSQDKFKIGEASKEELLQAEIDLNDTQYNLRQIQQQYNTLNIQLLDSLQLEKDPDIILNKDSKIITRLKQLTDKIEIDDIDKQKYIDNSVKTSSQFAQILNQKEYLNKELDWLKKEDTFKVTLEGSYDSESEFAASVNLSYNIFDSELQVIKEKNKNQEIDNIQLTLKSLYQQSENSLKNIIDKVELAELEKKNLIIKYDKVKNEKEIVKKQFEAGAVNKEVLENNRLNEQNMLINLKKSYDQIFLNKLDLLIFSKPGDIIGEVRSK